MTSVCLVRRCKCVKSLYQGTVANTDGTASLTGGTSQNVLLITTDTQTPKRGSIASCLLSDTAMEPDEESQSQALLEDRDRAQHQDDDDRMAIEAEVGYNPHARKRAYRDHGNTKANLVITIFGILVTGGAILLHYSGLEKVDLSFQDDKCYFGDELTSFGLYVDACMTREAPTKGTDCGAPAANAFCVNQGANYFVNFTLTDVQSKRGAITLGNSFIGGHLGFERVCCDAGRYEPATSRILVLIGGTALLFGIAALVARMVLSLMEASAAWLGLEAGEVLYFLLGVEEPLKMLIFSSTLVWWVDYTLWIVWCGQGIDCEAHGSQVRDTIFNLARVLLMFSGGAFFAKATPRIISMRYLYAGQFQRVRETMRNESLLAALTRPEVRDIIAKRQAHAPSGSATRVVAAPPGGPHPTSPHNNKKHPHHHSKAPHSGGNRVADLQSMLEASGYVQGGGSAVRRFRQFLDHYSNATENELAEEAAAEGAILFDNLIGAWDVNQDGAVGLHDFEDLFRQVKPPPGFRNAQHAAKKAWALFDLNLDGRLGRGEVIRALDAIYHDRANTARTVLSNESAVQSLETAIGFVLYTLLLFAAASLLGISSGGESNSYLDFFTTYILALSFIFGDTVRSVFRSTLYLFAEQPYSVGDYLDIDGELWCVESFDLVYTQLRKWEFNQFAKMPNDMLIDSKLINVSRGGTFKDTLNVSAPLDLPMSAVKELKELMVAAGNEKPKDIVPGTPHVKVDSIESGQVMTLCLEWCYNFQPYDRQRVDDTREYMVAACKDALVAVGVSEQGLNLDFKLGRMTKHKKTN